MSFSLSLEFTLIEAWRKRKFLAFYGRPKESNCYSLKPGPYQFPKVNRIKMDNGVSSRLTVKRISSSPYFSFDFSQLEKETIEGFKTAEMLPLNSSEITSVLITNTHTDLSLVSDQQLKACQLMIHPNSGYDNFSREFVALAQFPIVLGNEIRANAVTNYILSALFSHYSAIPVEQNWNKLRKWPRKLLSELNILILGQGHIGSLLKSSLSPLVKEVRVYDPHAGLPDLNLQKIDVLIPACSLNSFNQSFIDEFMLLQLNEDFLLINAARGDLVNTEELIEVLKLRPRAFAILDVFEKEPCDFSLFSSLTNISLSSHIAGVYANIDQVTANFVARVIADFSELSPEEFDQLYESMLLKNRLHADGFLI